MSQRSQTTPKPQFSPSLNKDTSGLLQRQCDCGNLAGLTGKCSACQEKPLTLQRKERSQNATPDVPPIVHEVSQLPISNIQPKLKIGQPNDKYEQEADRIADQVMRMPEPSAMPNKLAIEEENLSIQRSESLEDELDRLEEDLQLKPLVGTEFIQRQELEDEEKDEEEKMLQTKRSSSQVPEVIPNIEMGIQRLRRSGGQSLPPSIRTFMEPRFGYDFSKVRLHTTGHAVQLANQLNAQAFTTGHDIVLGAGIPSGQTTARTHLLAHELTHVIQQSRDSIAISSLSSHNSIPSIQRSPATVETQEDNEKDLRKAKQFKRTVNRWLRRIARKIARGEKIEPEPRQIRLAERALLLISAGEVNLPPENSKAVRDQLKQLTAVKFEEESPIIIQASPEWEISSGVATSGRKGASLPNLAKQIGLPERAWQCINPLKMAGEQDSDISQADFEEKWWEFVEAGDTFSVSHLLPGQPANKFYIQLFIAGSKEANLVQLFWSGVQSSADPDFDMEDAAKRGENPITDFLIFGHQFGGTMYGSATDVATGNQISPQTILSDPDELTPPSYSNAKSQEFNRFCWLARDAKAQVAGCRTAQFALDFAKLYMGLPGKLNFTTARIIPSCIEKKNLGRLEGKSPNKRRYCKAYDSLFFTRRSGGYIQTPSKKTKDFGPFLPKDKAEFFSSKFWRHSILQ